MSNFHFSENLHISAMVQIGRLNTEINLENLANKLDINKNILYIEYGSLVNKGVNNKKFSEKKQASRKYFYNQITIHIFNALKKNNRVNVKIFNNGRIQMTGINDDKIGEQTMDSLIHELNVFNSDKEIFSNSEEIQRIGDLETVLINSDFDIKMPIKRDVLHRLIVKEGYLSSYEPCNYPGVNIKYYYNPLLDNKGICECECPCNGKGKDNTCKRITIAVFKSGSIIITGGRNKRHIQIAYEFITKFIEKYKQELLVNN